MAGNDAICEKLISFSPESESESERVHSRPLKEYHTAGGGARLLILLVYCAVFKNVYCCCRYLVLS